MQLKTRVLAGTSTVIVAGAPEHRRRCIASVRGRTGIKLPDDQYTVAGSSGTAGGNCEITATIQVNGTHHRDRLHQFQPVLHGESPAGMTAIDVTHVVTRAMDEWPSRPEKTQTFLIGTTGQRLMDRPAISGYFTLTITNPGSSVITVAAVHQAVFHDAAEEPAAPSTCQETSWTQELDMQFLIALAVAAMIGLAACIFTFIIIGTTYWWRRSWRQVIADIHHSRSGDTAMTDFINRYRWLLVGAVAIVSALAVIVAAGRGGTFSRPAAISFSDVPTSATQNPAQGQDDQAGSQTPSPGRTYPYHGDHAQGDGRGRHWWGGGSWREQKPTPAPTPTTHTSTPGLTTPTPTPTSSTPVPSGTFAWTSTGQFATYSTDGFKWNNDAWGSGAGSQTIEINSPSDWTVVSNQAYQLYQVQTYPDIFVNPNEPVSHYTAITSTASEQSPSGSGEYNEAAYNIWLNGTPGTNAGGDGSTSVMIWTDCHNVSVNNEGTYTIGGTQYYFNKSLVQPGNFYQWTFVQLTNTSTQTTNILAVLDWIAAHGGPSSPTLTAIDFGWEIWGTEGAQTFHVSNFSLTMTP